MDWQIIGLWIGLAVTFILGLVNLLWGPAILVRREKIKISVPRPNYAIHMHDRVLRVFCSVSFRRLGGEEVRNVDQICLKPDAQTYHKLQKYFSLSNDGVIIIPVQLSLPRGATVSSHNTVGASHPEYNTLMKTNDMEKWKIAAQAVSELEQKPFKVRLVWEDGGKTMWKKIKQKDFGWITL